MNKRIAFAGTLLAVLTGVQSCIAGTTECTSTIKGGTIQGDVDVPPGAECLLLLVTVTGNVTDRGFLLFDFGIIGGNLVADHASALRLNATLVYGNVQADHTSGPQASSICGSSIFGDLQIQESGSAAYWGIGFVDDCGLAGNSVHGNMDVHDNVGQVNVGQNIVGGNLDLNNNTGRSQIAYNTVFGSLGCQNDNPTPTGAGNTAVQKTGQCAFF